MPMSKLAEGKTKSVFSTTSPDEVVLEFKDDITAGDGKKHAILTGKGRINASMTVTLYRFLEKQGLPTHLIRRTDENRLLVRRLKMIPIEVVCRMRAAGHIVGLGKYFKHREKLKTPIIEFYLKDDALHDPFINRYHVIALGLANEKEIAEIERITERAAAALERLFEDRNMILADFKIEFGRGKDGKIAIGDELSPDSMRIWDKQTLEILDKDRFRKDMPKIFELAYEEPFRRISRE